MKILIGTDHYGENTCGGIEGVVANVVDGLLRHGDDVSVVAGRVRGAGRGRVVPVPFLDLTGIAGLQIGLIAPRSRALRDAVRWADAVLLNSPHFSTTRALARICRSTRTPFVVAVHVSSNARGALAFPLRTYDRLYGDRLLRNANAVIAVSETIAKELAARLPGLPVSLVPNGVDLDEYCPGNHDDASERPLRAMFTGRFIVNKDPVTLAKAVSRLDGLVSATFVGTGPEAGTLTELAKATPSIEIVQPVPTVAPLLRGADVFVRTSRSEGMSLAILEAMATGLAIIASGIEPNRELLGEAAIYVEPGDTDGLAAALRDLATDRDCLRRLGAAARDRAMSYGWERTVSRTKSVLHQVRSACALA